MSRWTDEERLQLIKEFHCAEEPTKLSDLAFKVSRDDINWLIEQAEKAAHLEETVRIYKLSDEHVREQAKKVRHLFPLDNIPGYGQLCDKVLELSGEQSPSLPLETESEALTGSDQKARVVKHYVSGYREYPVGTIVDVDDEAVFDRGNWLCDQYSDAFQKHFELVKQESKNK